MQIVQPRLIVALGSVPSIAICAGEEPHPLEKLRGNWHEWNDIPVRASETPAFLLTASTNKKREFWEDLLAAMEKLEMPISEKQRGYFQGK
jgi:DNA polymerase